MNRALVAASLLIAASAVCVAEDSAKPIVPAARIELFNGKDFSGWTFFMRDGGNPTNAWNIRDGLIHCAGQPMGYLRTESDYRDYKLTVEWRFVKVAARADNTGVLVHIQSPDQVWPVCVQCQGKHEAQGDLFLMAGAESKEHRGKDANTALPKAGPSNEKAVGEWNTCELFCRGNSVEAWINGKRMNETTECTVSSGRIGVQCEGAEFEIRRVVLEPLNPSPSVTR